jgi:hypothetical protein
MGNYFGRSQETQIPNGIGAPWKKIKPCIRFAATASQFLGQRFNKDEIENESAYTAEK